MTSKTKLIQKLLSAPQNLRYSEIETLFHDSNKYEIREGKGSHKLIIHKDSGKFTTIALHDNDCKFSAKKSLQAFYKLTNN